MRVLLSLEMPTSMGFKWYGKGQVIALQEGDGSRGIVAVLIRRHK